MAWLMSQLPLPGPGLGEQDGTHSPLGSTAASRTSITRASFQVRL